MQLFRGQTQSQSCCLLVRTLKTVLKVFMERFPMRSKRLDLFSTKHFAWLLHQLPVSFDMQQVFPVCGVEYFDRDGLHLCRLSKRRLLAISSLLALCTPLDVLYAGVRHGHHRRPTADKLRDRLQGVGAAITVDLAT